MGRPLYVRRGPATVTGDCWTAQCHWGDPGRRAALPEVRRRLRSRHRSVPSWEGWCCADFFSPFSSLVDANHPTARPSGRPSGSSRCFLRSPKSCSTSEPPLAWAGERTVSLLPSFPEILFDRGAGDRVVGRPQWCDYPPAALAVPSVGDGMPPNIEAVLARRPDLVVLYNSGPNVAAAKQFERIGIKTALIDLNRLQDLGAATRELGRLTGQFDQADSLANILDSIAGQAMRR